MYEAAFRAHRGQSPTENHEESAQLYAEFSKTASENEYAWNYGRYDDPKTIGTVTEKNRMICSPCKYPFPIPHLPLNIPPLNPVAESSVPRKYEANNHSQQ